MSELKISENLSLPREAVTWVIAYLAKRGAGKTYDASVQAEEMLKAKIPIIVLDGMGIWWGLRVSADGKGEGLPIVVFGGEHADLPLVPEKASEMAKAIVESNISCVLDLSNLSKYAMRKIVIDFLDELYKLNRAERHVFIEESDMFAMQKPISQDQLQCLSTVDNFVRRGGNHNLGCTLITQRSAVLNKDILTQSDCLVILRTLAPQDKKAIQAWVEEQTDKDKIALKEWYDSLKTLDNGEAWVWHPEKPAIFQKVKYRQRETFHATREFIRSPQSSKLQLMAVDVFVEKFKSVFNAEQPKEECNNKQLPDNAENGKLKEKIGLLEADKKNLQKMVEDGNKAHNEMCQEIDNLEEKLESSEAFQKALTAFLFPNGLPTPTTNQVERALGIETNISPNEVNVGLQKTVTVIDLEVAKKTVVANTENMRGKIMVLAKKGKLSTWLPLGDIVGLVEAEHWTAPPAEVNNALNDLEKQDLIAKRRTNRNEYCLAQNVEFVEK